MHIQKILMIQGQKAYYRKNYRRMVLLCMVSFSITIVLLLLVNYFFFTRPEPTYYATSSAGAGFITPLRALNAPNQSSTALLKPDPPEERQMKNLNEGGIITH